MAERNKTALIAMSGGVDPIAASVCTIVLIYFCVKLQKGASQKISDMIAQNKRNQLERKA